MKKALIVFVFFCICCTLATASGKAETAPSQERLVLRYADNQPADYPTTLAAKRLAELVEQRTNGRIQIEVFCDGVLGDERSIIEQLQFGGMDMARVSLSPLAEFVPQLNILQLPYLYRDSEHLWKVLDGEIGDSFLEAAESKGLKGLAWFDAGARSFYTSEKPITRLEDMKGMTIRVQESQLMVDMIAALGATATQTSYADVYSNLLTGAIDGAENNWPSYEATKHYEVAKYFTLDEHNRIPEMQIISKIVWDKLSPEDQQTLKQAALESAIYERELWAQKEKAAEQKMMDSGTIVIHLSEAEKTRFQNAMSAIYKKYGQSSEALVQKIVSLK